MKEMDERTTYWIGRVMELEHEIDLLHDKTLRLERAIEEAEKKIRDLERKVGSIIVKW